MYHCTTLFRRLGLIAIISLSGCAHAYHAYLCGVPYGYCPDPPLPYTSYSGCPTPIASRYVSPPAPMLPPAPTN
ncbi:MAG: hypothetical protein U0941_28995 [Planctomycetaceae bacterium]